MEELIAAFPEHLETAIEIGNNTKFATTNTNLKNVLIIGLGGSGIGGTIVRELITDEVRIPVHSLKSYFLPKWVDNNTLVIACSYSGNTEETLNAFKQAKEIGAELACITSGGELLELAKADNINHIEIPANNPPRSMVGFSITSLLFVFAKYELISLDFKQQIIHTAKALRSTQKLIQEKATKIAEFLFKKLPVMYAADHIEGVLIRWRQQINENAKMLCWHHVIPEMNHNELVGWREKDNDKAVVFIRNKSDYDRIQKRMEINKEEISKYTKNIYEVYSVGESAIEEALYLIHLGDYVSVILSEKNDKDPLEIKVIEHLKSQLSKF